LPQETKAGGTIKPKKPYRNDAPRYQKTAIRWSEELQKNVIYSCLHLDDLHHSEEYHEKCTEHCRKITIPPFSHS